MESDPRRQFVISNALHLLGQDQKQVEFEGGELEKVQQSLVEARQIDLFVNDYTCTHLVVQAAVNEKVSDLF